MRRRRRSNPTRRRNPRRSKAGRHKSGRSINRRTPGAVGYRL